MSEQRRLGTTPDGRSLLVRTRCLRLAARVHVLRDAPSRERFAAAVMDGLTLRMLRLLAAIDAGSRRAP